MSARHYKRWRRLAALWPKDPQRTDDRNLSSRLDQLVTLAFPRAGQASRIRDNTLCEREYFALEDLVKNKHLKTYPMPYTTGAYGLNAEDLSKVLGEEGRGVLFVEVKKGWIERMFRFFRGDDELMKDNVMRKKELFIDRYVQILEQDSEDKD